MKTTKLHYDVLVDGRIYRIWDDGKVEKYSPTGWFNEYMCTKAHDRKEIVRQIREREINGKRRMASASQKSNNGH